MKKTGLIGCAIVAGLAFNGAALAENAYTSRDANLRAGPSRDYPIVAEIPEGSSVEVAGCLNDFAWCDVIAGSDRGWVYSGNLEYPYEGQRVAIIDEGPAIGLPIVTFSVGSYWDNYYRGRPWYSRRSYYYSRPLRTNRVWVRPSHTFRTPNRTVIGGRTGIRHDRPSGARPFQQRDRNPGPRAVAPRPAHVQPAQPVQQRPQQRPQQMRQREKQQKQPSRQVQPQRGRPGGDKKDHGRGN
ncbi:MAG: SH3 domain-containing protein [Acidobacteriota bacterium]